MASGGRADLVQQDIVLERIAGAIEDLVADVLYAADSGHVVPDRTPGVANDEGAVQPMAGRVAVEIVSVELCAKRAVESAPGERVACVRAWGSCWGGVYVCA